MKKEYIIIIAIAVALIISFAILMVFYAKEPVKSVLNNNIEQCFSKWDGSHIALSKLLKSSMNDPSSYEHVETRYWSRGDEIYIITTYRGKNGFGAIITESIAAYSTFDCHIFKVEEL